MTKMSIEILTKLGRPRSILRHAGPVVGPSLVLVRAQANHGLNGEAHARLRLADSLVLCVVGDVWRAVEQLIDAVSAVGLNDTATTALCMLLDCVAEIAEQDSGLDRLDGHVQTLARRLGDADRVCVEGCLFADIVGFIQIAVEAAVVECDVNVEDVAVD